MRLAPLLLLALAAAPARAEERVETWPDGSLRARTELDDAGRRSGTHEEYARDGTLLLRAHYRADRLDGKEQRWYADGTKRSVATWKAGELSGRYESFHPDGARERVAGYAGGLLDGRFEERSADGERVLKARYADGLLDGRLEIAARGKRLTRQEWEAGEPLEIDGLRPFPRRRAELLTELAAIQRTPAPSPDGALDPLDAERAAALRRLQAYRSLCGLPWQDMQLVSEWNAKCAAAAEVCRQLGRITHTPERPPGVDDDLYRAGREGAARSNLSMGPDLAGSVDSYMNDSDPSNIDRLGHRRWCLNPRMQRTGFGRAERFSAMWSMDQSGPGARGLEWVAYPPSGYVPVDLFGPRHAWSLAPTGGRVPKEQDLVVRVVPLGEHYLPVGEPLPLDYAQVADSAYGGLPCVIFRPVGLEVAVGRAYRVWVSFDGGKRAEYEALVEFVEPSTGASEAR